MIHQFGEAALLVETDGPDEAQALAAALRADPDVSAAVPALRSLLVEFDPLRVDVQVLRARITGVPGRSPAALPAGRMRALPVVYGGEFGPDLAEVARNAGLTPDDVVRLHVAAPLRVLFDGFAPGFAYLGDLPPQLHVPRLATPRTRTPRGSVGIAGAMSGIYPAELPGGWLVIGRTPLDLFDALRDPPAYLLPGDRVRFERIEASDWDRYAGSAGDW